jgi:hypothetical protein
MKKKLLSYLPIILGIIVLVVGGIFRFSGVLEKGEEKVLVRSTLMDAIDITELSTSQFTYNGIAKIYKNEDLSKIKCHVRYSAKVKAGIDMSEVDFEIDDINKTVKPILPNIQITTHLVEEKSLSFIPNHVNVDLKEVLTACKKDASQEALKSEQLMESSEENLKSIIEALIYPILESHGYTIVWE